MKKLLLLSILLLNMVSEAFATDLMDVYMQALENDTTFKAAYSAYMSSAENIPQARSALYPQILISGQTAQGYQDAISRAIKSKVYYGKTLWNVNATQAIFNYGAWAQVQKAKAGVKASQAGFNDAAQDLILRTSTAYFNVLLTEDTLRFAEAKKRANRRQLEQADQRFKVGVTTITNYYEAKAAYDRSVADVISAKNTRATQNENLGRLTNHIYESIAGLRDGKIPLIKPEPLKVDEWVDTGLKQNYKLLAAKYNLQAARENLKGITAGSWPVLQLQGNANQVHNVVPRDGTVFLPGAETQATVALTLNFPVFQGGLIQSQTRQAQFDFQTYSEKLEQAHRDTVANSRIAFNSILENISKIGADRQTIISIQNSLDSVEAQFSAGTRTMLDVVIAQQNLFEAQLRLATDQYSLINFILNLKYQAGTLNVNDLEQINTWLATTRVNAFPPAPGIPK